MFTLGYQGDLAPIISRIEDAFLADDFALGVVVFAMAVQDYPGPQPRKVRWAPMSWTTFSVWLQKKPGARGQWTREM